ncbi:MAG: hypothetical protein ACYTBX_18135, partial [Planctomycetota bacterium]
MNVNLYNTTDYENKSNWTPGENKPNSNPIQSQTKPIAERVKLMQSLYLQRIMKINGCGESGETNPNKANLKNRSQKSEDRVRSSILCPPSSVRGTSLLARGSFFTN